jgi:hypothetical protein
MGVGHGMVRFFSRLVGTASGCLAISLCLCLGQLLAAPAAAHSVSHAPPPPPPPPKDPDPYAHGGGDDKGVRNHQDTDRQNAQNVAHERHGSSKVPDAHHASQSHEPHRASDGHDAHQRHDQHGHEGDDAHHTHDPQEAIGGAKVHAATPLPSPPPLPPPAHPVPLTASGPQVVGPPVGLDASSSTIADAVAAIAAAPAAASPQSGAEPGMMRVGAPTADGKSVAPSAADAKNAAEATVHAKPKAPPQSARLDLAPTLEAFRSDQILAYDLSVEARNQLSAQQKYRMEAALAGGVTRLILPDYVSPSEELVTLQARFPDQSFGLNFKYSTYRGAGEGGPPPILPHGQSEGGCDAARCYGPAMIGWRPELAACARNVVVGIIDTGLDRTHSAVSRLNLIQHPADAGRRSDTWHGTGVAALLAGARESRTPGLMPDTAFVVVDAFFAYGDQGGGERQAQTITDTDHLLWALETLQQHRAQVVNMSLVGPSDPAVHAMIRKMAHAGTVFVAAAGNGGPAGVAAFPAAYAEVIAVTAVDRNRHSYAEANHGGYIDMAAPGVRVWTALPGERQGFLSGTSFAVPFVTAIVAASYDATPMKTAGSDKRRTFNPKEEVLARVAIEKLGAGEAGTRDSIFGFGLVHAPANCAPWNRPDAVAAVERSPAREAASKAGHAPWQTQVHQASAFRPEPSGE